MGQAVWQTGRGGVPASDLDKYPLLVERLRTRVCRQLSRRRDVAGTGSPVLLASGNHDGVRAARDAADGGCGWRAGEWAA